MSSKPSRSRAVDEQEKLQRRQAILEAARNLIRDNCEQLPSVSEIASAAGLAKGTVYLYFSSKEAMFLALLAELYDALLCRIADIVRRSENSEVLTDAFLQCLDDYIRQHPYFMPLAAMADTVIEKNVSETEVIQFKECLVNRLEDIGEQLHHLFPRLSQEDGGRLMVHTHALMIGLWQMQNWPERLRALMREPRFALVAPDFASTLPHAVRSLWVGALNR